MIETRPIHKSKLEEHFSSYRKNIIGQDEVFNGPFGKKRIIYADWTASGRLYGPIEHKFIKEIYPVVGNTHTETNFTGSTMTEAYDEAKQIIKRHVGASPTDVLISAGSGMTGMVNKLQRLLGLRIHEKHMSAVSASEDEKPVVFVTHMEHHSNQTSWEECLVDVVIIPATEEGLVDIDALRELLIKHKNRRTKIAAVTSCSNVTGIKTPYHDIARLMHRAGGYCFVDFACSAPYIEICMRPQNDPEAHLDAIYFSPHKFLGGPGSSGILIFCPRLYKNKIPDNPGGGTVNWTNPWGGRKYFDAIEQREDGGTPAFLQTIRVALSVQLKEDMGVSKMLEREKELNDIIFDRLESIENVNILAGHIKERLGVYSFYIDGLHYNLGVKILNDRFGIQVRGGCSCAGTYGHYLLHVDEAHSNTITCRIDEGDFSEKPGWIRMSIHPTMTNEEVEYILDAIEALAENHEAWSREYAYDNHNNNFIHQNEASSDGTERVHHWFDSIG